MKKLMGFILLLLFLLILFLNKELEGLTQPDKQEWTTMIDKFKTYDKWEDFKVDTLILIMAMQNEKLKDLIQKGSFEETTLEKANTTLFEDVKKEKRKYTDQEYKFMNGLFTNNPTFANKTLKELNDYLKSRADIISRIKDEYKTDKDTTLKELDDKIKEE
jgi:hypothetical protein